MQVEKQQLEKLLTVSGFRKEYGETVYCRLVSLTSLHSTWLETNIWMNYKLIGWCTKEPLDKEKEEECRSRHQVQYYENSYHNTQSPNVMANKRGIRETVTDFLFLDSKVPGDGDFSHDIKSTRFLTGKLWQTWIVCRKTDITLSAKVHITKAAESILFLLFTYSCDRWAINAFELWCWRRLLESHG